MPVVLGAGAELTVALAFAPPVAGACVLAVDVTCWLGCETLGVVAVGAEGAGGGEGGGGISALRREAKVCVSLCCGAVEGCERGDALIIEELTSDVIPGALGTAALPEDNKRLMSACNRRASAARHGKAYEFSMLAGGPSRIEGDEMALIRQILPPAGVPVGAYCRCRPCAPGHGGAGGLHL